MGTESEQGCSSLPGTPPGSRAIPLLIPQGGYLLSIVIHEVSTGGTLRAERPTFHPSPRVTLEGVAVRA